MVVQELKQVVCMSYFMPRHAFFLYNIGPFKQPTGTHFIKRRPHKTLLLWGCAIVRQHDDICRHLSVFHLPLEGTPSSNQWWDACDDLLSSHTTRAKWSHCWSQVGKWTFQVSLPTPTKIFLAVWSYYKPTCRRLLGKASAENQNTVVSTLIKLPLARGYYCLPWSSGYSTVFDFKLTRSLDLAVHSTVVATAAGAEMPTGRIDRASPTVLKDRPCKSHRSHTGSWCTRQELRKRVDWIEPAVARG